MMNIQKLTLSILTCSALLFSNLSQANTNKDNLAAINDDTFQCITDMTKVRGFYVDNLNPDQLSDTVSIANKGSGVYPEGSVVQLVPTEVMVKHKKGTNPKTNDWEFFELIVKKDTSKINVRGFDEVKNRFGGNCLDCHKKAKSEFDLICEQGHGCDPIPITPLMTAALQKTDPRCETPQALTEQEKVALKQLQAAFSQ